MRPRTLEEVAGQAHILGPGKLLRRVIEADRLTNIILFGPPGCGKTTLAEVIARTTQRKFVRCSGVVSNVAEIRQVCDRARNELGGMGTILFIDEIHRFNKAQQDVLLPYVEDGTVVLIGATTHNPSMFVNTPLTSRSLVFQLKPLAPADVAALLDRALADPEPSRPRTWPPFSTARSPIPNAATARCPLRSTPTRGSSSPKSATATDATRSRPSKWPYAPPPPLPTA